MWFDVAAPVSAAVLYSLKASDTNRWAAIARPYRISEAIWRLRSLDRFVALLLAMTT